MALPSDDLLSPSSFRSRVSGQGIPRSTAHGHRDDPSRKDTRLCFGNGTPAGSGMAATPNAPSLIHEQEEHERQHQTRGTVRIYDHMIAVEVHNRSVVPGAAVEEYSFGWVAEIAGQIPSFRTEGDSFAPRLCSTSRR